MNLTKKQLEVLVTDGNLLVTGGPGSGKTTVSIHKAVRIIKHDLRLGQKVLFLSFARASVSRVIEVVRYEKLFPEQERRIVIETYHSFYWRILQSYGYLVGLPRRLNILAPSAEAVALSATRIKFGSQRSRGDKERAAEHEELCHIAKGEGRVAFDLFAPYVSDLLHGSDRLRKLLATMYPVVILDEFQDTNESQWSVIQALGAYGRIIALADPEQRIFDFTGAHPERLNHYRDYFAPVQIDFYNENHRSLGDIGAFGDDVLKKRFKKEKYKSIEIDYFDPSRDQGLEKLVNVTKDARERLIESGKQNWSLAVLVPYKRTTKRVSAKFREISEGRELIAHTAIVDFEASALAAEIIAHLMQQNNESSHFETLVGLLCNYFRGKGGNKPTKTALKKAEGIGKAYRKWCVAHAKGRSPHSKSVIRNLDMVYRETRTITLSGKPTQDWRMVREVLAIGACPCLKEIAEEVKYIRLLDRGTQLRQDLIQDWRDNGTYRFALEIMQQAFTEEYFAAIDKFRSGVVVMNMHKAKGKEFDEVIIFEGPSHWDYKKNKIICTDRIVWNNDRSKIKEEVLHNFRVSVTRARQRTTILTPRHDPCVLLP